MQLYFYCSYTNAARGFFLTRLEGGELTGADLSSRQGAEAAVDDFFSYDRFRLLWQEFPRGTALLPEPAEGILGVRGLEGKLSERDGTVNFALLAPREELKSLERLALGMLADLDGFARGLLGCLSIGGPWGYQADVPALEALFRETARREGAPLSPPGARPLSARDLLRLAVYTGSWKEVSEHLRPGWLWMRRPRQALSQEEFSRRFSCTVLAPRGGGEAV